MRIIRLFAICSFVSAFVFLSIGFAQETQDVVYLKNGSVIRGTVIEQVPGKSLKIKTSDGSVFVYTMDEVEKYESWHNYRLEVGARREHDDGRNPQGKDLRRRCDRWLLVLRNSNH